LKFSPYIKDAAVLGRDRDRLSAIVCIDREAVGLWAEQRGISYMSYADLAQNARVAELVAEAVRRVNRTLPQGLRLHEFVCLHKEFDPDDGEITRTRKIRRNIVEQRYKPIIDAIYGREKQVLMQAKITYESGETGVIERMLAVLEA
jgi:long-chain acyl-CoA synthetase